MDRPENGKKTCFVVQGFGKKTDYRSGRVLDLDASYEVIKEAVEAAGLKCIRADEIQHSGVIDKPMYEQILDADLVIADLSTSNVNAFYELGVRHAVRPRTTIIVAEDKFDFAFDINHTAIRTYEHLGPDLGRKEAKRFSEMLTASIREVLDDAEAVDSPVYTFLPKLRPPTTEIAEAVVKRLEKQAADATLTGTVSLQSVKVFTDQAKALMKQGNFGEAKAMLRAAHAIRPHDDFIVQQLVLATYKSKSPDEESALKEAHDLMVEHLDPKTTNDPETIGLWAAVHKRMWALGEDPQHLEESIGSLEHGFMVKSDYYNGINLAFMLNLRASRSQPAEAIADFVQAQRVRRKVMKICGERLETGIEDADETYWVLATMWEAAVGLGDAAAAETWKQKATEQATADWMVESTAQQIEQLSKLLTPSPLEHLSSADSVG